MDARRELDSHFSRLPDGDAGRRDMDRYVSIAEGYAELENVLVVLSNLDRKESIVVHGSFSQMLDIDMEKCADRIPSIWEDGIFRAIHPDDLYRKLVHELLFYHHIVRLPRDRRFGRCLMQRIRMRSRSGEWMEVLHRLRYIPAADDRHPWLALCLYGALPEWFKGETIVTDFATGQMFPLDNSSGCTILSRQEVAVLKLIDNGYRSRGIADMLNISIHTVSRHRQNIIAKLRVRNSAEACKVARGIGLI